MDVFDIFKVLKMKMIAFQSWISLTLTFKGSRAKIKISPRVTLAPAYFSPTMVSTVGAGPPLPLDFFLAGCCAASPLPPQAALESRFCSPRDHLGEYVPLEVGTADGTVVVGVAKIRSSAVMLVDYKDMPARIPEEVHLA